MTERHFALKQYPLSWPDGWKREVDFRRKQGHFKLMGSRASVNTGFNRILDELRLMGIKRDDVLISTNVPTRLDGLPRSDQREPIDPGAAVYWRKDQNSAHQCIAIDIYTKVADNLCAIAATLEALRAIERHGGAQVQERSFRGFAALPASTAKRHWRDVFGSAALLVTREAIEQEYRHLLQTRHPDRGGSHDEMAELNVAREDALREING
jgi:hypothetical protein